MIDKVKQAYNSQKSGAKKRGIEWNFNFESWLDWWGDDIHKRGRSKGCLVMARTGDVGAYQPDNVRKTTHEENIIEAKLGKPKTAEHKAKISQANKLRTVEIRAKVSQAMKGNKNASKC